MASKTILVAGSLNYDMVFKVQRLPLKGETYTADSLTICGGGKGANQAVQCAKLGIKTYMAGKVGADAMGDTLLAGLAGFGVDTSRVTKSKTHSTGMAAVNALPDGSVYATISTGANFDISTDFAAEIDDLLKECTAVVLQLEIPTLVVEEILQRAKRYGVYTILNAAPAKPLSPKALKNVDCLVVNETEASFYVKEGVFDLASAQKQGDKLMGLTGGTVVITLGKNGSLLCNRQGQTHFKADPTVKAIETTGAGDSYIGALAVKKVLGASDQDACQYASKVADYTVTRIGAQESMPTYKDISPCL